MSGNNMPIISLEVQGMRQTVRVALSQYAMELDSSIQEAVERFCEDGNVRRIVEQEARAQIEAALKEEVRHFFSWNNGGRAAVRSAVLEALEQRYPTDKDVEVKTQQA